MFFAAKIDLMTSYQATLTATKLIKMTLFAMKIYCIPSKSNSNLTHTKNHFWVSVTSKILYACMYTQTSQHVT